MVKRMSLSESVSHSRKFTTDFWTIICTLARCSASRSAKNGSWS